MQTFKTIICNTDELKMDKLTIKRVHKRDDCTLSVVIAGDFMCKMLELPDKGNKKNISCIPEGVYQAKKRISPGKGYEVIEYINVPNRTYIQMHYGNYTRQLLGCQLPGVEFKDLDGDGIPDITSTEDTLKEILAIMPNIFTIEIK
jgi:hypothetical protein|tara:strand:+ start:3014 stop:3451 length:438 start_codon:yes stop_codon:yes gene_type:complete